MRIYLNKNNLALLLLITGMLAFLPACKSKEQAASENAVQIDQWTCSMHPEIIRDQPGTCPICGMDLVKITKNATAFSGIQLDELLQPTNQFVVSSIPVVSINRKPEQVEAEALGTIAYDSRLENTISARVSGRIEKLYVHYRYQHVVKGQKIMDIYSPDLLTDQQELLLLIRNDPENHSLINAATQRLRLLGMGERQLQQVIKTGKAMPTVAVYSNYTGHIHEAGSMPGVNVPGKQADMSRITDELSLKEGMYVQKDQTIFQVYNVDKSWVLLSIFPEYASLIKTGDAVRIIPETAPSKNFGAKIDFIEPVYRKENKTITARIYFDNSKLDIPVGSQVRATIFTNMPEAGWLPKDAVLSLGLDKVVFIKDDGGFRVHKVETGLINNDMIQIVSGLSKNDKVAANAQFLTDSESFIKTDKK